MNSANANPKITHFYRTSVYHSLFIPQCLRDGVFGNDGLSGASVCRDEDAFVAFNGVD